MMCSVKNLEVVTEFGSGYGLLPCWLTDIMDSTQAPIMEELQFNWTSSGSEIQSEPTVTIILERNLNQQKFTQY